MKQGLYTWAFRLVIIGYCCHNIRKICRFTFHIICRVFCFHNLIQTGSVHFDKFFCFDRSKLCTGTFNIQGCIVFDRSIAATCQDVSRIAAVCV